MCGFAGIVGVMNDRAAVVAAMTSAIVHRGPDDHGAFDDEVCSLGHRRLSIIDLSTSGRQPMTNEDGTIHLAFNGEVYNFQDLRRDLIARGHRFRSRTDTEVLVHLYEERGDQMVEDLRGMFAFALWDAPRRRLLLARDHFGQKPLFYAERNGSLFFASEIKALLAAGIDRRPDPVALDLMFRTQLVPSPHSCFAEIRRLPPATVLVRDGDGRTSQRRFWTLEGRPTRRIRMDEAIDETNELLRASVREQLVADVPVGIFVSGGIDSSLILEATAADGRRPESFTLGYQEQQYSEVDAARRVTAQRETSHHVVVMSATDAARPEKLVDMFDEPFVDVAALPLLHLARYAREYVKVALTGDGGDELFAGYEHHLVGYWLGHHARVDAIRVASAKFLLALARRVGHRADKAQRVLRPMTGHSWRDAIMTMRMPVSDELRRELYTDDFLRAGADEPVGRYLLGDAATSGEPPLSALFSPSGDRFLADRLLHKTDIASMAVSLECRSPFLDLRLAELAASLPLQLKISGLTGKQVLRKLLSRNNERAVWARRKTGFTMPLDRWIKSELREIVNDTLLAPTARIRDYLHQPVLVRMYHEHCGGIANWRRVLWSALLLELWLRRVAR